MRLLSFRPTPESKIRAGALIGGNTVLDLAGAHEAMVYRQNGQVPDDPSGTIQSSPLGSVLGILRSGETGLERAREIIRWSESELIESEEVEPSPLLFESTAVVFEAVIPNPGKIVATGWNFGDHIDETKDLAEAEIPSFPTGFMKLPSSLTGHNQPIVLPRNVPHVDYEIEVAAVMGKSGYRIDSSEASSHIAGFTIMNDVSARDLQLAEMKAGLLLGGKNYPTFAPMGPCLVTSDELESISSLEMVLRVNGETRQHSSTSHMIWSFSNLVGYWSSLFPLEVGDAISSGTPPGVALGYPADEAEAYYLQDGDVVEAEVESLGVLRNPLQSER
jgi:2-keto-4-pentenoate hydratase/2-oxohepta-3-ene-1,7-dioic acid hydratase in catechol pathway